MTANADIWKRYTNPKSSVTFRIIKRRPVIQLSNNWNADNICLTRQLSISKQMCQTSTYFLEYCRLTRHKFIKHSHTHSYHEKFGR